MKAQRTEQAQTELEHIEVKNNGAEIACFCYRKLNWVKLIWTTENLTAHQEYTLNPCFHAQLQRLK